MKKNLFAVCFICCTFYGLFAANDLLTGLDAYSRGDWTASAAALERALVTLPDERTETLYWLVMAESSAQNYQRAVDYADAFLEQAREDSRAAEVIYQKGRVLHEAGNSEQSSAVLYRFIADYPDHPKVPSAYYWIGENLYAAGSYPEARKVFSKILIDYPNSGKAEGARYKIVLIDQQAVRDELSQIASQTEALASQNPQPETEATPLASDDERNSNEDLTYRLTVLEERLDALSAALDRMSAEQENRHIQEQQELEAKQQQEAEQQKRRQELQELQERTRTLEKMYEQRMKGAQ